MRKHLYYNACEGALRDGLDAPMLSWSTKQPLWWECGLKIEASGIRPRHHKCRSNCYARFRFVNLSHCLRPDHAATLLSTMGNDGGSIPTRRELVKSAARNPTISDLKEKQKEHLAHRWSQCPLSHKALVKPVVADYSGDLYNKDAIIQYLLPDDVSSIDKAEAEAFLQGRVKGLKDVVEISFEMEHDEKKNIDKRVCPVTGKELGPAVKAVYLVPCGHAFSSEAIKEMKSNECVQCGQQYESPRDVLPILPVSEEDKALVMERIEQLKALGLTHSLKKDKSGKKRKVKEVTGEDEAIKNGKAKDLHMNGADAASKTSGIKHSATANLTARVLEEQEEKKKRRLLNENENIQSLFTKSNGDKKNQSSDFMTRGFSIPANAKHG